MLYIQWFLIVYGGEWKKNQFFTGFMEQKRYNNSISWVFCYS